MGDPIMVTFAPAKVTQILTAARKQLSDADYRELAALISSLQYGGLTPEVNARLGRLMSQIDWELEIGESLEWAQALIECDRAFLGAELKEMCLDMGMEARGHKKEICRRLYHRGHPRVVAVMEPFLNHEGVA
jgi:hypothetical protein